MPVRLVLFDLGGVLVRIRTQWRDCLEEIGLETRHGRDWNPWLGEFAPFAAFQRGDVHAGEVFAALAAFLGIDDVRDAERASAAILHEPYPGGLELVEALHDAGIETGVLSNTNAPHWQEMLQSGRFPAVPATRHRFASQELRLEKPQPEIFRFVQNAVGLRPQEIIFFDDVAPNVEGARAEGWHAILVPATDDPVGFMRERLAEHGLPVSISTEQPI
ncbi:MAG: Alpha-D-glucose 1-phosphate phosphatase YihX [Fimbriimonadaceae bacterium]|nr:Alpha-D-glucose 1-phosphate phosphatase YihX [Fimbriimonadaceae bacterium]